MKKLKYELFGKEFLFESSADAQLWLQFLQHKVISHGWGNWEEEE